MTHCQMMSSFLYGAESHFFDKFLYQFTLIYRQTRNLEKNYETNNNIAGIL